MLFPVAIENKSEITLSIFDVYFLVFIKEKSERSKVQGAIFVTLERLGSCSGNFCFLHFSSRERWNQWEFSVVQEGDEWNK